MKKLFILSLLLLSSITFGQIKISPVKMGWPQKTATDVMVRVLPFETDAAQCQLHYQIRSELGEILADGNLTLIVLEFGEWGYDNRHLEDITLQRLSLTRKD